MEEIAASNKVTLLQSSYFRMFGIKSLTILMRQLNKPDLHLSFKYNKITAEFTTLKNGRLHK